MSLDTWKQEYFPIPAGAATGNAISAVEHSLRKWEGMLPANLARHNVNVSGSDYRVLVDSDDENNTMAMAGSCALCDYTSIRQGSDHNYYGCEECPIYLATGRACDNSMDDDDEEDVSPWNIWLLTADPEPKIALLYQTRDGIINPREHTM